MAENVGCELAEANVVPSLIGGKNRYEVLSGCTNKVSEKMSG